MADYFFKQVSMLVGGPQFQITADRIIRSLKVRNRHEMSVAVHVVIILRDKRGDWAAKRYEYKFDEKLIRS